MDRKSAIVLISAIIVGNGQAPKHAVIEAKALADELTTQGVLDPEPSTEAVTGNTGVETSTITLADTTQDSESSESQASS